MKTRIRIFASIGFAVALALTGCASSSESADTDVSGSGDEAAQPEAPPEEPAAGSMSGPSDFADCPDGVTEGMDSISSAVWHDLDISEVVLPEGVAFPVPSCAISNPDATWVKLIYIGADLTLFDELDAQLIANDFIADPGTSEEFSSYHDSEMRAFVEFSYVAEVGPESFASQFLGAPHVVASFTF